MQYNAIRFFGWLVGENGRKFGKVAIFSRFFWYNTIQYNIIHYNIIFWTICVKNGRKLGKVAIFCVLCRNLGGNLENSWFLAIFFGYNIIQYNTIQYNMIFLSILCRNLGGCSIVLFYCDILFDCLNRIKRVQCHFYRNNIVLHRIVSYCILLYCIVLYCIVLYCIYCIVLYCGVLFDCIDRLKRD